MQDIISCKNNIVSFFMSMSFLFTAIFAVIGAFMQFYPVFLDSQGLSTQQISYAMSLSSVGYIIAMAIAVMIISKSRYPQFFLVGLSLIAISIMGMMDILDMSGTMLIVMTLFFSMIWSVNILLSDAFALRMCHLAPALDYGRMRLFGSISFIGAGIVCGMLIDGYGITMLLYFMMVMMLLTSVTGLCLPNFYSAEQTDKATPLYDIITSLVSNVSVMRIIIGASMIYASNAVFMQYSAIFWSNQGYTNQMIAWFMAVGVIAEIIILWYAKMIEKHFIISHYFLIAGIASVVRWLGMSLEPSMMVIFCLQMLQAFTFGLLHLGVIRFIREQLSPSQQASGQMVYGGMMWGIIMVPAMLLGGYSYSLWGNGAYYVMCLVAVGGMAIVFSGLIFKIKNTSYIFYTKKQSFQ